ncbi:MAG: hypothetical protein CMF29_08850 [Kiritimatiellaceae bacterium]|nr:hypothetical protein [Kiritimatiellaceae bacterium]|tara:strand:- start:1898 stop:2140 length:243 start_codon:yes stop_codon:yes gene_type:complete
MDLEDTYSARAEEIAVSVWDMTLAEVRVELKDSLNALGWTVDDIHSLLYEKRIEKIIDNAISAEVDGQIDEYKEIKHGAS